LFRVALLLLAAGLPVAELRLPPAAQSFSVSEIGTLSFAVACLAFLPGRKK
jgi:hypothetical protein